MTPQEALATLHGLVEQMQLNGPQRDTAREAAKTLQNVLVGLKEAEDMMPSHDGAKEETPVVD